MKILVLGVGGIGGFFGGYFFALQGTYIWSFAFAGIVGFVNVLILWQFWLRIKRKQQLNY